MCADIGKAGSLDVGDPVRIAGRLGLGEEGARSRVGGEDEIDQRSGAARRFLLDAAEPGVARQLNVAALRRQFAGDHAKQRGLARPVAADEADARAVGQAQPSPSNSSRGPSR